MMEEIKRPKILERNGKLSEYVKGFIVDRSGGVIGVVLVDSKRLVIEFFGRVSPMLVYDKITGEADIMFEEFPTDPRKVLKRFIKNRGHD